MNKKTLIDKLPGLQLQVFLITLAVFLGLVANDWNQSIKDDEMKQQAKEMIYQEVQHNHDKISNAFKYHVMLMDSLSVYEKMDVRSLGDLKFWSGLRTPTLSESSYKTSMTTGVISLFTMKEIKHITDAYTLHKRYESATILSLQTMLQLDISRDPKAIKNMISKVLMLLNDIYWIEKDILHTYTETLKVLK